MEKFAYELENLFQEKLTVYETLKRVFEKEKLYIVDMDVDALWKMTGRKNQLASDIQSVREQVLAVVQANQITLDMGIDTFNSNRIIDQVPFSPELKTNLKSINVKLNTIKKEIAVLAQLNKQFVNDHLSVINGIFSTITGSENREQYTYTGVLTEDKAPNHLIRAEV